MNSDRIKEIQSQTAYPQSVSVKQALLQVWNECEQEQFAIPVVSVRKIVRCEDPMVCLRGCSVHEQTCRHPIYYR